MKKLLYMILFGLLFLSGCEKKTSDIAPAKLYEMDGESTYSGVSPGMGKKNLLTRIKIIRSKWLTMILFPTTL